MADYDPENLGEKLIELLCQQKLLYKQLFELAQQQTDLVSGDNPEWLLRVLAARQRLIDRLSQINQQLEPIRLEWQRISNALPPAKREEVNRLVEAVQDLLAKIIDRDDIDSKNLSDKKQGVAKEIRSASQGRKVNNAYAAAKPAKSRFVDTQTT